jgi:hypothetical protein
VFLRLFLSLVVFMALAGAATLVAAEPGKTPDVIVGVKKGQIEFRIGPELVARYHTGPEVAKPYFWPLNAPGGAPVTRAYPMVKGVPGESEDHIHQKSAWFCHGDVIPQGLELKHKVRGVEGVDFWSEASGSGRIVCTRVGEPRQQKGRASVVTNNEWRTADGTKIMDETRVITLHDLGDARLFVLDIDLHASVVPITFGDTKEGSMGVRVHDQITEKSGKGRLENAEGKAGEKVVWGHWSDWCDYSGPVNGKTVGIAIFDDPSNPSRAGWHSRGYGLMAANPFGRNRSGFPALKGKTDLVKLNKGEHFKLRYGLLIHNLDAKEGKVAERYREFLKLKVISH